MVGEEGKKVEKRDVEEMKVAKKRCRRKSKRERRRLICQTYTIFSASPLLV